MIDLGQKVGEKGGEIVLQGKINGAVKANGESLTLQYLAGEHKIDVPKKRRTSNNQLLIREAFLHNLKNINPVFKLGVFNFLTCVSGSVKSTFVFEMFYHIFNTLL